MCGIVGYVSTRKPIGNLTGFHTAVNLIRHRGPDDEGYVLFNIENQKSWEFCGPDSPQDIRNQQPSIMTASEIQHHVALGFRRYSIVEMSSKGHQPFWSKDKNLCLTFNGEIYNYVELRSELEKQGYTFTTRSDTEVLLAAYLIWGPDCLSRFNGPFAIALYDVIEKKLFLARDRIGKSPLYYAIVNGRLFWASEIKSIFSLVNRKNFLINDQAVYDYLRYNWRDLDYSTFWRGIRSLESASWIWIDCKKDIDDKIILNGSKTFWTIPKRRLTTTDVSFAEAKTRFQEIFSDSIRIRARADARVAFGLSGGLDSSSIVGICASRFQDKIASYTVKYAEKYADEEPYAREVYKRYKGSIDYNIYRPRNVDFWKRADDFVWLQEEPFHSPNLEVAQAYYRKVREDGFRVIVSGAAGDEMLAGYREYFFPYLLSLMGNKKYIGLLKHLFGYTEHSIFRSTLKVARYLLWRASGHSGYMVRRDVVKDYLHGQRWIESIINRSGPPTDFNQRMVENMSQWKMNYWQRSGNKATFGIPIESRSPFLDYRLVDFVFGLPPEYLLCNGWTKYILRKSVENILPKEIAWRRKKMGFPFNYKEWLIASMPVAVGHMQSACDNPYIDTRSIINDYRKLADRNSIFLWRCISFCLWWKRIILGQSLLP